MQCVLCSIGSEQSGHRSFTRLNWLLWLPPKLLECNYLKIALWALKRIVKRVLRCLINCNYIHRSKHSACGWWGSLVDSWQDLSDDNRGCKTATSSLDVANVQSEMDCSLGWSFPMWGWLFEKRHEGGVCKMKSTPFWFYSSPTSGNGWKSKKITTPSSKKKWDQKY